SPHADAAAAADRRLGERGVPPSRDRAASRRQPLPQPCEQALALAPRFGERLRGERAHVPAAGELESGGVAPVPYVQAGHGPAARVESASALPLHVVLLERGWHAHPTPRRPVGLLCARGDGVTWLALRPPPSPLSGSCRARRDAGVAAFRPPTSEAAC